MMQPRILLVEDDAELSALVRRGLEREGLAVSERRTGAEALDAAEHDAPDALVLDIGLPDSDGRDVCQALRARGITAPVLFLTARDAVVDRLAGFGAGGDDYLVKPFDLDELVARLRALLRRVTGETISLYKVGELAMNLVSREVIRGKRKIDLTAREFRLLEYLMRSPGQVMTRTQIIERVWEYHFDPGTNLVDVYIQRLRRKLDRPGSESCIRTRRGEGYQLSVAPDPP